MFLAHLMNTGLGPFYDGLLHFFVTPEDLLPVLALAMLAGLRGPASGRAVLFVLPVAWMAGGIAGRAMAPHTVPAAAAAVLTIALGGLVAADRDLPIAFVGACAVALGLVHGAINGAESAKLDSGVLGNTLGVACGIFVTVSLLAALVTSLRAPAARIVVRVGGSWIAAAGLFMLGWSLRPA